MTPEPQWFITRHAMARMTDMKLTRPEVIGVIERPECDYASRDNCRVATQGKLAVVYSPERHSVLTVVWNQEEVERGRASAKTERKKLERLGQRRSG